MDDQSLILLNQAFTLPSGMVLPNRLAKSAMSQALATYDNHPTALLVELYRRWAASGIGMLITGNVMIDRRALGEPGNVGIEDEADIAVLKQWTVIPHRHQTQSRRLSKRRLV